MEIHHLVSLVLAVLGVALSLIAVSSGDWTVLKSTTPVASLSVGLNSQCVSAGGTVACSDLAYAGSSGLRTLIETTKVISTIAVVLIISIIVCLVWSVHHSTPKSMLYATMATVIVSIALLSVYGAVPNALKKATSSTAKLDTKTQPTAELGFSYWLYLAATVMFVFSGGLAVYQQHNFGIHSKRKFRRTHMMTGHELRTNRSHM